MKFSARKIFLIISLIFLAGPLNAQQKGPPPSGVPDGRPPEKPNPNQPLPPPPRRPENIMNYRGNRTYSKNCPMKIKQIRATRVGEQNVSIEVIFNQSINPRSVKHSSILVDDKTLNDEIRFMFNKMGDTLKFELPLQEQFQGDTFELKMWGIRSFDGSVMECIKIPVKIEGEEEL